MILSIVWLIWFGTVSLYALSVLVRRPRLWLPCLLVLGTSAVLVLYLPVREYFHTASSFDPLGDGFGIFAEFLGLVMLVGPFHLGFLLMLAGWRIQEPMYDVRKQLGDCQGCRQS